MAKYTYAKDENNLHLGGNIIEGDPATYCPTVWKYVIDKYSVKTVMDVGSGRGYALNWFADNGMDAFGIEGLSENVKNSLHKTIEHDLTKGKYVHPVDLVNCIEVVEHIEEQYLDNLLQTLSSGKYLIMSHAVPGQESGWHHVNCKDQEYWITHLSRYGLNYSEEDTFQIRKLAKADKAKHISRHGLFFKK